MSRYLLALLLLIPLSTPLPQTQKLLTNHTPQQRPTRTLGSLFGSSKPSPPTPPQNQPPQQNEQKSINTQQYGSGVRPLVYQVKYYDRVQNNLIDYPDPRNYNAIDKASVGVVEQPQGVVQNIQGQVISQPPIIPSRYYYNPLIPPIQEPIVYTLANIGNTQVLIPCSTPSTDPYSIYDSTIALNVEQPQQIQQPSIRVPVTQQYQQQHQNQPPVPTSLPNRTPLLPPSTVQQPLIREQVVAAAAELSALNALPGSGIVGANINSVPYTQGSYFYYYLLPGNQQDPQQVPVQIQPQVRYQQPLAYQPTYTPQHNPYTQFINPYTRYNQNQVIPVVLTGYPGGGYPGNPQVVIPQPSNVNTVVNKGQTQQSSQSQGQTTQQQQQQQQQVKG